MEQTWRNLLFAHWPYVAADIRAVLPSTLRLDTFDGMAWVGVVPFLLEGLRFRAIPRLPFASTFPELNVRTYVSVGGKPGVYFFSLDAASRLAVVAAREFLHLNYYHAQMSMSQTSDGFEYGAQRVDSHGTTASFKARYQPVADATTPAAGTLDHFLTERYCLYAARRTNYLSRLEIAHPPWRLHTAEAELDARDMLVAAGLPAPRGAPLLHFSSLQSMIAWAPQRIA